jgi:anti-sigma B factor antagonist
MTMKIEIERPGEGTVVVHATGRMDADAAPELKQNLREIAKGGTTTVTVDLKDVTFIDSSGLSALVSGLKALREHGGALLLCRPQPQAMKALRLTLLDRVFPIYTSLEQALREGELYTP